MKRQAAVDRVEDWGALSRHAVRLAAAMGARPSQAADLAQEAILRLVARQDVRHPKAWLRTVVRRLLHQFRRKPVEESLEALDERALRSDDSRADLSIQIRRVLADLRGDDRKILLMTLVGLKQREIGRRMGWSVRSVGSRISRAQARARELRDSGRV